MHSLILRSHCPLWNGEASHFSWRAIISALCSKAAWSASKMHHVNSNFQATFSEQTHSLLTKDCYNTTMLNYVQIMDNLTRDYDKTRHECHQLIHYGAGVSWSVMKQWDRNWDHKRPPWLKIIRHRCRIWGIALARACTCVCVCQCVCGTCSVGLYVFDLTTLTFLHCCCLTCRKCACGYKSSWA